MRYTTTAADHAAEFAAFMRLNNRVTTLRPHDTPPSIPPQPRVARSVKFSESESQFYADMDAIYRRMNSYRR